MTYFFNPLRVGYRVMSPMRMYTFRRAYQRALALRDYLYALSRRVGALVELTGQEFDGENTCTSVSTMLSDTISSCGSENTVRFA